jgi:hypothetical protein
MTSKRSKQLLPALPNREILKSCRKDRFDFIIIEQFFHELFAIKDVQLFTPLPLDLLTRFIWPRA